MQMKDPEHQPLPGEAAPVPEAVLAQAEALIREIEERVIRQCHTGTFVLGSILAMVGIADAIVNSRHPSESVSLLFIVAIVLLSVEFILYIISSIYYAPRPGGRGIHVLRTAKPVFLPMTITSLPEGGHIISTGCAAKNPGKLSPSLSAEGTFGLWRFSAPGSLSGLSKPDSFTDTGYDFCVVYRLRDKSYPVVILTSYCVFMCR
jgi:hypothetical protein